MQTTVYAGMNNRELAELAICRDTRSQLETELAQRLLIALDLLEDAPTQHGIYPRRQSQSAC